MPSVLVLLLQPLLNLEHGLLGRQRLLPRNRLKALQRLQVRLMVPLLLQHHPLLQFLRKVRDLVELAVLRRRTRHNLTVLTLHQRLMVPQLLDRRHPHLLLLAIQHRLLQRLLLYGLRRQLLHLVLEPLQPFIQALDTGRQVLFHIYII